MPSEKDKPETPVKETEAPVAEATPEVERDGTAPNQQLSGDGNQEQEFVYLPGIISDEFGISRSQASQEIATGSITIDGEPYTGSKDEIPLDDVAGKTVEVKGGNTRTFRFQIDARP